MSISLVLDIGHNQVRYGYAGDSNPRFTSPSYFGEWCEDSIQEGFGNLSQEEIKEKIKNQFIGDNPPKHIFGSMLGTKNPIYKYNSLFPLEKDILKTFFTEEVCLKFNEANPKNQPLIVSEPSKQDQDYREAVGSILENGLVSKIFIAKKAALSLYSCGKASGVVLEAGARTTTISPLEDGYVLKDYVQETKFGGDIITDTIMEDLTFKNVENDNIRIEDDDLPLYQESCLNYYKRIEAENIKKKLFSLKNHEDSSYLSI